LIYYWAGTFNEVSVLDSNQCQDPYGTYELVLGVQIYSKFTLNTYDDQAIERLNLLSTKGDFTFISLSYDLKEGFHQIQSQNIIKYPTPLVELTNYVKLIKLKRSGTLEIISRDLDPEEIYTSILNHTKKTSLLPRISWNHQPSRESYHSHFQKIHQHLLDGDIYEVNYCHCFEGKISSTGLSLDLFRSINQEAPKPFSAFHASSNREVLCFSPERFMLKGGSSILTQPIKGTIDEGTDEISEKIRSENMMIVDLCRNDLAQISKTGTVKVPELLGRHPFKNLHHIISTIQSELRDDVQFSDILRATFPMGSMTGAPKHSAMKIIEEQESFQRGIYSGALGYIDENGDFDLNVVIRTCIVLKPSHQVYLPVGGALLFDSIEQEEYEETLQKIKFLQER
jgi:para-aminobenzoate synthetase component 1